MLILSGRDILLEKRVSAGIWGGLWCVPQLEQGLGSVEEYMLRNQFEVRDMVELMKFTHSFTHFKLHITPILMHINSENRKKLPPGCVWLDVDEALGSAIPKPVRELIHRLLAML
jgi:A/G-specific adenine glycosylase